VSVETAQSQDFTRFQKLTKTVWANKVQSLIPDDLNVLAKDLPFEKKAKLGDVYYQPVTVSRAMGVTFWSDGGVQALRKGLASKTVDAQVRGQEILVRDQLSYAAMNRSMGGDKTAFIEATKQTFANLTETGAFMREASLLYGGGASANANLGVVESVSDSSGTLTLVITAATWSPALWVGCENGEYDIYTSGGASRSSAGTDAARTDVFVLSSVTPSTRTLVFVSHATNTAAVAATDQIFFAGARANMMIGLEAMCTISGSLWNISNSTYAVWKNQSLAVGGRLTFETVMAGLTKVAEMGHTGKVNLYCSPGGMQDLINDQTSLIRHTESKSGGIVKMGYSGIEFYSQVGVCAIKPHKLMKNGYAYGLPDGECMRLGSTDLTFEQPGVGKMVSELPDNAGIQARIYTDQALFIQKPRAVIQFTGIVNSR
jgi:hypothetical protein